LSAFRRSVRGFLAHEISPYVEEWDRARRMPYREVYRALGERRLLGIEYPPSVGGLGLDYRYKRVFGEELGRLDTYGVGMSVSVHTDMCTPALAAHGNAEIIERFLRPAVAGTAVGAIALTDPAGGSDFDAVSTTLRPRGGDFVLNGVKAYITNGSEADFLVVLARSSDTAPVAAAFTMIVVPGSADGVTATRYQDKLGNWCCDHAEVRFDDVLVPREHIVGEVGLGYALQADQFVRERLMAAIMAAAQGRRLLTRALDYSRQRRAFGRALAEFENVSDRLVELEMQLTMTEAVLGECVEALREDRDAGKRILVAKIAACRAWMLAAELLMRVMAGRGYLDDASAQRAYRDARAAAIAAGTEETLMRNLTGYLQ
jgi:alkylation response protein AidB-like acyl-CoA dehydrogenase